MPVYYLAAAWAPCCRVVERDVLSRQGPIKMDMVWEVGEKENADEPRGASVGVIKGRPCFIHRVTCELTAGWRICHPRAMQERPKQWHIILACILVT